MPRWLALLLLALVILRVGYHSAYLAEVPFAVATFSDGRLYERAAFDILSAPPLGTEPFYLQGLYAYQLAIPMLIRPWISLGLLLQLVLAGVALYGLFRATASWQGRRQAGLGLAVALAYPGLSFYENKYLTASLAVVTMVGVLVAFARMQRKPTAASVVVVGMAAGLAVLARGNMLLAVPAVALAVAMVWSSAGRSRLRAMSWLLLGILLTLGPMAARNAVVTGRASVMPVHGGGTSFYIGNNRHARGVWNDAGGMLSGEVVNEREELVARLGIADGSHADQAAAIGRALYRKSAEEMAADPGGWLWLELRKAWLMIGNDELSQDYDTLGERELVPWWAGRGLPFSVLMALGIAGALAVRRRARHEPEFAVVARPWLWLLGGQAFAVIAANLLFFTSAQHRVPLVVPLAMLAGPGLALLFSARDTRDVGRISLRRVAWIVLIVVCAQGAWPRLRRHEASAVHYYNLAIAYDRLGQQDTSLQAYDRALARSPDHPVMLLERASLHRRLGHLGPAATDLRRLATISPLPPWVARRAADEVRRVKALRGLEDR